METIEHFRGTVPAKAVANYVLDWSSKHGRGRSNLEIQKLVYFCHVCYLVKTGTPLIRESFEAWQYGPVVPNLYKALKEFGEKPVNSKLTSLSAASGKQEVVKKDWTAAEQEILDEAMQAYGQLTPSQLIKVSHERNGPWDKRFEPGLRETLGSRILNSDIAACYSKKSSSPH